MEEQMSVDIEKTGARSPRARQLAAAARGRETQTQRKGRKKTTERTLIARMLSRLEQLETETGDPMGELLANTYTKARAGDKDALAFIGKYLLGNGKVSLDEIYNPPIIRKAK
jgi:hypothetical protein